MKEHEVLEMQRRIDEGIRLAHERLWQRAGSTSQTLIVAREGKIMEMRPEGIFHSVSSNGDPLARRKK